MSNLKPKPAIPGLPEYLLKWQVLELVPVSYATLWDWMRRGLFPLPIELGPPGGRTTKIVWKASEVRAWLESRPRRQFTPVLPEHEYNFPLPPRKPVSRKARGPPRLDRSATTRTDNNEES